MFLVLPCTLHNLYLLPISQLKIKKMKIKNLLLSFYSLTITLTAFAQQQLFKNTDIAVEYTNTITNSVQSASSASPFFTNTFSAAGDWTISSSNGQDWVVGTNPPSGQYSGPMGAITSTTANDGFAMFDSDALASSATNTQDATITYNGTVNCSGYSGVSINFESYHRKFQDSVFVEVSNDAWNTFERFEVHASQAVNDQSDNPEMISINISNVAGNQASVSFRFHYEGQWDYAWMVDDVSFQELQDNNADLTSLNIVQYSIAPANINISGEVTNIGGNTINAMDISWSDGTNSYTDNLTGLNIVPSATYTFTHANQLSLGSPTSVNITDVGLPNDN